MIKNSAVKLIVSDSDHLTNTTADKLRSVFGCPVINRYDNEENGLLAYTTKDSDEFFVNRASYIMELLKLDADEPAEKGELGRIVITDLFNEATLFIRYDTGDLARTNDEDRHDIKTFYSLEGRSSDLIYATNGSPVSTVTVDACLEVFYNISRYQLIQTGKQAYVLKVVCKQDEYLEEALREKLKSILRDDANITVEYVSEIPLGENGKYKSMYSAIDINKTGKTNV